MRVKSVPSDCPVKEIIVVDKLRDNSLKVNNFIYKD
jgi:hypothetical protein